MVEGAQRAVRWGPQVNVEPWVFCVPSGRHDQKRQKVKPDGARFGDLPGQGPLQGWAKGSEAALRSLPRGAQVCHWAPAIEAVFQGCRPLWNELIHCREARDRLTCVGCPRTCTTHHCHPPTAVPASGDHCALDEFPSDAKACEEVRSDGRQARETLIRVHTDWTQKLR